jgi:hypothetical protein
MVLLNGSENSFAIVMENSKSCQQPLDASSIQGLQLCFSQASTAIWDRSVLECLLPPQIAIIGNST